VDHAASGRRFWIGPKENKGIVIAVLNSCRSPWTAQVWSCQPGTPPGSRPPDCGRAGASASPAVDRGRSRDEDYLEISNSPIEISSLYRGPILFVPVVRGSRLAEDSAVGREAEHLSAILSQKSTVLRAITLPPLRWVSIPGSTQMRLVSGQSMN
jgi:hypothetical protein